MPVVELGSPEVMGKSATEYLSSENLR